jgi:hypothetical protein
MQAKSLFLKFPNFASRSALQKKARSVGQADTISVTLAEGNYLQKNKSIESFPLQV